MFSWLIGRFGSTTRETKRDAQPGLRLRLCSPYATDELCQTDIVRVELVHAHAHGDRRHTQRPSNKRAESGELAFMEVIHQNGIEPDVAMNDEADAE